MGGVTPKGKVFTPVRPQSLNGLHTIAFLARPGRLGEDRLLVIWDGSPTHRRAEVGAFRGPRAVFLWIAPSGAKRGTGSRHAGLKLTIFRGRVPVPVFRLVVDSAIDDGLVGAR